MAVGDHAAELHYLTQAVTIWPHESQYWSELARARRAAGFTGSGPEALAQVTLALEAAERALALNPPHLTLHSNWALLAGEKAARTGDRQLAERARTVHAQVTSQAPEYWLYWRAMGVTERRLGNHAAAASAFARALSLFEEPSVWGDLVESLARSGDPAVVQEAQQRVGERRPRDEALRRRLEALFSRWGRAAAMAGAGAPLAVTPE